MNKNLNTPDYWDTQFKLEAGFWASGEEGFVRWLPDKFDLIAQLLPKSGKILDLGSGLGHFCRYMNAYRPNCYEMYGSDFSKFAVETAKANDKLTHYQVASVYQLPYPDKTFDAVNIMEFIEHLSDIPTFLSEVQRVSKTGATIIVTTPERNPISEELHSVEHIQEFTPVELRDILETICRGGEVIGYDSGDRNRASQYTTNNTMVYRGYRR